jgi:Fic family protein
MSTSWLIADLAESKGKQELFTKQSPQKLKILREHAIIESAVSSNRIEGVTIDQKRVGTVIFGKSLLRDRNEEEIRGYRDELKRECPNVSVDMIRKVLKDLNKQGKIRSTGRGQNARWEKIN